MKRILYMRDGSGMYTKGIKDKETAVKMMREDAQKEYDLDHVDWCSYYKFKPNDINIDTVKETRYYQHRRCDIETIGDDSICYECGEDCGTGGRKTFAFIN